MMSLDGVSTKASQETANKKTEKDNKSKNKIKRKFDVS